MIDKANRIALFLFILGFLVFLGLVFSPWTVPYLIQPAALTIWLFFRIFILSVNQAYYWWLAILLGMVWVFYRLSRREEPVLRREYPLQNEALSNLRHWQELLIDSKRDGKLRSIFKQELILLLTSHFASKQNRSNKLEIRQALESGQLSLPKILYDFLFLPEPAKFHRLSVRAFSQACHRRYRQLTGKEAADLNRTIDELIHFMENTTKNENPFHE